MRDPSPAILIVEDLEDDRLLIERAFSKLRLANPLHFVHDGEQACAYLAGEGPYADRAAHPVPALVLLDLKLPRRSGHEVITWVRARPGLRRMPIVVLTSSDQGEDVRRAYDLGANSYLIKPVAFEDLLRLMQTLNLYWMVFNQPPECSP